VKQNKILKCTTGIATGLPWNFGFYKRCNPNFTYKTMISVQLASFPCSRLYIKSFSYFRRRVTTTQPFNLLQFIR